MIPDGVLSTVEVPAAFAEQVNRPSFPLVDYEMGGIALQDISQGLFLQLWTAEYKSGSVYISSPTHSETILFTRPGITMISLAFDGGMNPVLSFTDADGGWLWWYDASIPAYDYVSIPGATNPKVALDEKREWHSTDRDVILSYNKGTDLCYRQQRDRFLIEYILESGFTLQLLSLCMNVAGRLQWRFRPA